MKELQERIAEITSELSKATKELGKVIDRHADDPTELRYSLKIIGTVLAEAHSNAAMVVRDLAVCIKFAKDEGLEIRTQKAGGMCGSCEDTGLYLHHGGGEFFCTCETGEAKRKGIEIPPQEMEEEEVCPRCKNTGTYIQETTGKEHFCSCEAGDIRRKRNIGLLPLKKCKREFICKRCKDTGKAIGSGDIGRERYCDCNIGKAKWDAFVMAHPQRSRPFLPQYKEGIER